MWWRSKGETAYKEFREELAKLKRMVEERDLDWIDMRSRCKRLLDRTEKAARLQQPIEPTNGDAASPELTETTSGGRVLSPRQLAIQQQILKRRAHL